MRPKPKQDKAFLLAIARAVAAKLKSEASGTRLRIRTPNRAAGTNTDGWSAVIGNLGKGKPRLEIWLDRFSGYPERKLYACFRTDQRSQLTSITKRVSRKLWPVRVVTTKDTEQEKHLVLAERLARGQFTVPVLEKYTKGQTFYGIYDPTRETSARVNPHFCARAVAFFEDVARALPNAAAEDEQRQVYPRTENRKRVASHLQRERSALLAAECKIRDNYKCQVCGLRFEDKYGSLGSGFAEAHHRVPLNQLRTRVKTNLRDLATVCANCHRMLHRMDGKHQDLVRLRSIIRNHRRRRH